VRSFEGDAAKALQDAAALDELIDSLLSAKTKQEVRLCSMCHQWQQQQHQQQRRWRVTAMNDAIAGSKCNVMCRCVYSSLVVCLLRFKQRAVGLHLPPAQH
jgi:hypothetical protein